MDIDGFKGDVYQTGIVTQYEVLKYTRSKRLFLSIAIVILLFILITALGFMASGGLTKDGIEFMDTYSSGAMFVVIFVCTLMSAGALVSEFEERTALIMFTRPVKKGSIFAGKFIANFIVVVVILLIYYLMSVVWCFIWTGGVPSGVPTSIGMATLFALGTTGLALLFSSISKKGIVAAILTFVVLLLMWMMVDSSLMVMEIEPVFSLTYAGTAIAAAITGATTQLIEFDDMGIQVPGMDGFYNYIAEPAMAVGIMLVWFAVTTLLSFLIFRRRQF